MTNTVIDGGGKLPGPQIGAIILGISQVPDGQSEARPLGDLRRVAENCGKNKKATRYQSCYADGPPRTCGTI